VGARQEESLSGARAPGIAETALRDGGRDESAKAIAAWRSRHGL
jgi:hypothetical protein